MYHHLNYAQNLPEVINKQTSFGRFYQSPNTYLWYPSVTTVTGYAKSAFFAEWRKNPENAKKMNASANKGTRVHNIIEKILQNDNTVLNNSDLFSKIIVDQMSGYLKKIQNIHYQEVCLWSDMMKMAGRVDCVGEYDGVLSVIDFKTSTKEKKEEWITNYFEQTSCYAVMHKERFGKSIEQVVVLITCDDGTIQEFVRPVKHYVPLLVKTIKNYYADHDFEEIQARIINE